MCDVPRLFGINNSNRDYTNPETWGKNQFNSSFPAALACYLYSKGLSAVYIKADQNLNSIIDYIGVESLFGIDPLAENTYYSFESPYLPYQRYVIGNIPRNDLVIINTSDNSCSSCIEIKLTALPDNSTCNLDENLYGSEIVIRPDTIIYLACSIIEKFDDDIAQLGRILNGVGERIDDWTHAENVLPYINEMRRAIMEIVSLKNDKQKPIIMEPIWKTEGKSPRLSENCLDVFVWSDFGMLNLFFPEENVELRNISRHTRSLVWLYKMLWDYSREGHFNGSYIIDELSYNTKNDKAFSTNGSRTHSLMACNELITPRISKNEIKEIILGGGQNLLSPERRFDAIIYNSPELFY